LIKLLGFLDLKQTRGELRDLAQSGTANRQERWSSMLALSRMGDGYAIENVMNRVKKLPVNDDVVYQIFPDLIYTRQRVAIEYLMAQVNNDAKNCRRASGDNETRIPCAYRIMEMLAPVVESFPLQVDSSGDLATDDYDGALRDVRNWFRENKDFKILTETY
jgi:hypothetical protein